MGKIIGIASMLPVNVEIAELFVALDAGIVTPEKSRDHVWMHDGVGCF